MSVFWALRKAIHFALKQEQCVQCSSTKDLDIHHIKHDGTKIRHMWGLFGSPDQWDPVQTLAYFSDMLWGIFKGLNEVEILCRKCHTKHHKKFGYE